jgi:hypothetical protein
MWIALPWCRYGVRCADNHTGTHAPDMLNVTRIFDPQARHVLEINLSENNLIGTLPTSIGEFQFLKYGSCSPMLSAACLFHSPVPRACGACLPLSVPVPVLLCHCLCLCLCLSLSRQFYMDGNNISGTFPATFGNLNFLALARFQNNLMTGTLPSELGRCERLEYLSMARNQFTGTIPTTVYNLTKLRTLYLSQNYFVDPIPPGTGCCRGRCRGLLADVGVVAAATTSSGCYDSCCSP